MFASIGGGITYLKPLLGIPILILLFGGGIYLILRARQIEKKRQPLNNYKNEGTSIERVRINNEIQAARNNKALEGSLDNVGLQDRLFIRERHFDMLQIHGDSDYWGMLADRADNIPLNKLMTGKCSICGIPRNQKGKKHEY